MAGIDAAGAGAEGDPVGAAAKGRSTAAPPGPRYAVAVFRPPGYPLIQALDDVAWSIHFGLLALGRDSVLTTSLANAGRRTILLGANEFPRFGVDTRALAPDTILYNLEQLAAESFYVNNDYLALLRAFETWDYSRSNVAWLARKGIAARHLPIGAMPQMAHIAPAPAQDVDVFFYGALNERRDRILAALADAGHSVLHRFGVYGRERAALIARAKIVLNVHYYESRIFEAVRVAYLLVNGVCVVSEDGVDPDEAEFAPGLAFAPYSGLVGTCSALLADAQRRTALGAAARRLMGERRMDAYLAPLVG